MAKTAKERIKVSEPEREAGVPTVRRQLHYFQLWKCHHHFDCTEIELYSEISGEMELNIMVTGQNHIALAEFIAHAANERNQTPNLLNDAIAALKRCLDDTKLSFEPARAAASVVLRAEGKPNVA